MGAPVDKVRWFRFYNLDRGVNNYTIDRKINMGEAREELNARVDEDGAVQQRRANPNWQGASTPYHASAVNGLMRGVTDLNGHEVNRGNPAATVDYTATQYSSVLMGLQNEDLIHDHDEDGAFTKLMDHAGALIMRAIQWRNSRVYLFFGAGANAKRFGFNANASSAATIYDMNIPKKAIGSAAGTSSGAGSITEGYYCAAFSLIYGPYTDNNARNLQWAESVVNTRTAEFHIEAADTGEKYVINTLTAESSNAVRARRFYMTEAQAASGTAVNAQLYLVGDMRATDTTVSWDDASHPTDLKKPALTSEDTGSIPDLNVHFACVHNDRLFYVTDEYKDRVGFSNEGKPDEHPDDNWFRLKYENTGIIPFLGDLVICMESQIEVMRGWSPEEFGVSKEIVDASRGCIAPDSLAVVNVRGRPMLFFVSRHRYGKAAIYAWDGQEVYHIGRKVQGTMDDLTSSQIAKIRATAHGDRYLMGCGDDDKVLCYDTVGDRWHPWDGMPVNCWAKAEGPADNGELYWGQSTTGGMVKKADGDGYDTCSFRHYSGYNDFGQPELVKATRYFYLEIEHNALPITVHLSFDGGRVDNNFTIPAQLVGSGWNEGTWENFRFSRTGSDTIGIWTEIEGLQFRNVSVGFDSFDSKNHKVVGCSFGYTPIGGRIG